MAAILFLKAHNKGYTRKDGKYVGPYDDKRPSAKKKAKKPAHSQHSLFGGESKGSYQDKYIGHHKGPWHKPHHGAAKQPKPYSPPAGAVKHPKRNEHGGPAYINKPSEPTPLANWDSPDAIATVVPGGDMPAELNGVPFAPWTDHPRTDGAWDYVDGQMEDLNEPALQLTGKLEPGSGVVVEESDGRVWVIHPSNQFAGYETTFPKGHGEDGLSLQANAIKECFEESGLKVQITGLLGDFKRTTTVCRYYRAVRVGGSPSDMGWESQAVSLVPKDKLYEFLNAGNDREIAEAAGAKAPKDQYTDVSGWTKVGKQMGSNDGGVYQAPSGAKWYVKFPADRNVARNEVLAARLYAAAGVRVPKVGLVKDGGKIGVASKMIDGLKQNADALKAGPRGVADAFAVDAWLANWDAVGAVYDNMLLDGHGQAVRIDPGGALIYRAQGGKKGAAFGPEVGELDTLRDPKLNPQAAAVFSHVTEDDIIRGVRSVLAVPDDKIIDMCTKFGPGSAKQRAALAETLIQRKENLAKQYPAADDRHLSDDDDLF